MNATLEITKGVLIPFVGTSLGAVCAIFMKKQLVASLQRVLSGFAAGVMVAASVWSLLLPAIDQASSYGTWAFIPATLGFWLGVFFLLFLNRAIPRLRTDSGESRGLFGRTRRTAMLVLAVTIHNIPEGMAVGAVYAGYRAGSFGITSMAAFTLALGIAIQNVPEGAIISMPLCDEGMSKSKAVLCGVLSGAVEPVAALLTLFASFLLVPAMPYFLSFAAGAMFYVVVKELIPEMTEGDSSDIGTVFFVFGFTLMMALDVALG